MNFSLETSISLKPNPWYNLFNSGVVGTVLQILGCFAWLLKFSPYEITFYSLPRVVTSCFNIAFTIQKSGIKEKAELPEGHLH